MPRRHLYILLVVTLVAIACYRKADSAHRSRYGRMFDTFVEIFEEIEQHYFEPIDERKLFEGALDGVVARLDPYSAYMPPVDAIRSRQHLDQQFGGIGIEVTFDAETRLLTVASPLVGTPAYDAGIMAGDKILQINGESTKGFTFDDALKRLRGKVGEPVTLQILHVGSEEPVSIRVVRATIKVDAVLGDHRRPDGSWEFMLPGDDKIGYLRIPSFGKRQVDETRQALEKLRADGMRGLILDLRNNGGGLLDGAIDTCDLFIRGDRYEGLLVTVQGRDKVLSQHRVTGKAPFADVPLVVLVNQNSASASEIVAASLQDHGRAVIVGQRTFGKGTVQEIKLLEDGQSELRLTIARYLRPSLENIHRSEDAREEDAWGVMPSPGFEVKLSDEQFREVFRARRQRDSLAPTKPPAAGKPPNGADPAAGDEADLDPQLNKAIEYLRELLRADATPRAA